MVSKKVQKNTPSTIKNLINKQNEMEKLLNEIMKNQIILWNELSSVIEFLSSDPDDDEECNCEECGCGCNCEGMTTDQLDKQFAEDTEEDNAEEDELQENVTTKNIKLN